MRGTPEDIQAVASENYHNGNLDPRLKAPRNVDIMALCDCYGSRVDAAKIVQSGKIGQVHFVRVWNFMGTGYGNPPVPDSEPPADLNWDAWLGPAPFVKFNRNRLGYRSFMDYTNGLITDYGNHRFDTVHQVMGQEVPTAVSSSAVRFNNSRGGDAEANKYLIRPYRKPWDLVKLA